MSRESFITKAHLGIAWLEAPALNQFPWLLHAFSTRQGGISRGVAAGLDLGNADAKPPLSVRRNRSRFLEAIRAQQFSFAAIHQIHSAEIFQVRAGESGGLDYLHSGHNSVTEDNTAMRSGDAMMTGEAGILLSVRTADCLPVLLVDSRLRIVSAVHAGWRGALKRIVEKAAGEMQRVFGSQPQHLFAALGPSIRACCYEVGEEVVDAFRGSFVNSEKFFRKLSKSGQRPAVVSGLSFLSMVPPGHAQLHGSGLGLDLVAVAMDQLESAGVPRAHIQVADFCTACRTDLFFSYRKEGKQTGRMMAVIGIRSEDGFRPI